MTEQLIIDKNLWFSLNDHECSGEHFIIGNPHTFNGRILGYCMEKRKSFYFSKTEINRMSLETKYWIEGYLSGNEPEPPTDSDGDVDFNSDSYLHWKESIELFHETGVWVAGERNCETCEKLLLNSWIGLQCKDCIKDNL